MKPLAGKIYRRFVPSNIQMRVDCLRAYKHWYKHKVIFIHVPKNAGVSVSKALYGTTLGHVRARDIKCILPKEFDNFFKFGFYREPVERYLSAYSYVRDNFKQLSGGSGLPLDGRLLCDPNTFFDAWLCKQNPNSVNYVFQLQSNFLCDEGGVLLVNFLGNYANFASEIAQLSHRVRELNNIKKLNVSSRDTITSLLSQEVTEKIQRYYSNDYLLLSSHVKE